MGSVIVLSIRLVVTGVVMRLTEMKDLGLVDSDKKIFSKIAFWKPFFTPLPTYATNWNGLNNFGLGITQGSFLWSLVKIKSLIVEDV